MKKKAQALKSVDAPNYKLWQGVYLSFFSASFYVDVLKRWKGFGIFYLLIAILVFTAPLGFKMTWNFYNFYQSQMIQPIESIPPFHLDNGIVKFDKPMPYIITNKEGKSVVVIDTTGVYEKLDINKNPDLRVLITENSFSLYFPMMPINFGYQNVDNASFKSEVFETPFPPVTATFTGKELLKATHIDVIFRTTFWALWPMAIGLYFGIYLSMIFLLSFMGQIVSQTIFKFPISYKQAFRLMTVAVTPQLAIFCLAITFQILETLVSTISVAILAVYFCYAIVVNRRVAKKLVRA